MVHALALIFGLTLQGPSDPVDKQALTHCRDGQTLLDREWFEEAKDEFRAAIQLAPMMVLAHYGLGQAHMATRDYAQAVAAFTEARAAFQNLAALRQADRLEAEALREEQIRTLIEQQRELRATLSTPSARGGNRVILEQIERLEQKIDLLRQLRDGYVGRPKIPAELSLALGSAYFRSEAFADAEREYQAALRVRPDLGEAHNNLAVVYMYLDRIEEALEQVRLAKEDGYRVHPDLERDIEARLPPH